MKIVWLTDLHLVEQGAAFPAGVDPLARARACLADVNARHADADLLVITGDLIQLRNPGAYDILRDLLADIPFPIRLLVGNHDDRNALLASFPTIATCDGFVQSVEMLGGYRIIYLDTLASGGQHYGELCERRLAWLETALSTERAPTLVFMHHPPFDVGIPALDALKLIDRDRRLASLFGQHDVRQIMCGHLHRSVSGNWLGLPVTIMKSPHVSFALDTRAPSLTRANDTPGYGIILINSDSVIVHTQDVSFRDS